MMWLRRDRSNAVLRKRLEYCGTFCRRILKFHVLWTGGSVVFSVGVQFVAGAIHPVMASLLVSERVKKTFCHTSTSPLQQGTKVLKNTPEVHFLF